MFKKVLKIMTIITAAIALASCTVYKPEERVKTVTVTGTGSTIVTPDLLTMKFYIRTSEWVIKYAIEKNANTTNKVIDAIKAVGVADSDISNVDYVISEDNSNTYAGKFSINNSVLVIVRDPALAGSIIEAAINNGALGLTDYVWTVSDKTTGIRQARTLAIQNAQDAASLLAGASGCKVNSVLDIKEEVQTFSTNSLTKDFQIAGTNITNIKDEGSITLTSTVTITYSITE
ncbi:MAG: SIMPL domain-containing protein [Treponema sp.]|nr:SIMPL domain-containing protein [Treponema sp.]